MPLRMRMSLRMRTKQEGRMRGLLMKQSCQETSIDKGCGNVSSFALAVVLTIR